MAVGLAVGLGDVVELSPVAGDHAYVVAPETVSVVLPPLQMVAPDETVTVGVEFIVTVVDAAALVQPEIIRVTEYVPEPAVVTPAIVGSSAVEVKLFGPVHE